VKSDAMKLFEEYYVDEHPEFAAALIEDACNKSPSFKKWYEERVAAAKAQKGVTP